MSSPTPTVENVVFQTSQITLIQTAPAPSNPRTEYSVHQTTLNIFPVVKDSLLLLETWHVPHKRDLIHALQLHSDSTNQHHQLNLIQKQLKSTFHLSASKIIELNHTITGSSIHQHNYFFAATNPTLLATYPGDRPVVTVKLKEAISFFSDKLTTSTTLLGIMLTLKSLKLPI